MLKKDFEKIKAPEILKEKKLWLLWRLEKKETGKKPLKIPYYVSGNRRRGVQGSTDDLAQLSTFDAAKKALAAGGFTGLGFAFVDGCGISGLDFDNCVKDGEIHAEVFEIVKDGYAEISPSGTGVHGFVKGNLGDRKNFNGEFGFEIFSTKGFLTFTGDVVPDVDLLGLANTVPEPSKTLQTLIKQRFPEAYNVEKNSTLAKKTGLSTAEIDQCLAVLDPDSDYDTWLKIGMAVHYETDAEGFEIWHDWSATGQKYPSREALEAKWHSFSLGDEARVSGAFLLTLTRGKTNIYDKYFGATDADFSVIPESDLVQEATYKIQSLPDFSTKTATVQWLIKKVLPRAALGVVYGESASGKTFLTLDMCAAMALGRDWRGFKTPKARVLYIVAEGAIGFRGRLKAYCDANTVELEEMSMWVIADATPNFASVDSVNNLCRDIRGFGAFDIVVVDTLSQVTHGANENSGEDMGRVLLACKAVGKASGGATVLLVHHSGKDGTKGARGHSSLRAACDFEAEVLRDNAQRKMRISKLKDGQDGSEFHFSLTEVAVDVDEDGEAISSCVVEHLAIEALDAKKPVGPIEKILVDIVREKRAIDTEACLSLAVSFLLVEEGKRDTRRQRVSRALESLLLKKELFMRDDKVVYDELQHATYDNHSRPLQL